MYAFSGTLKPFIAAIKAAFRCSSVAVAVSFSESINIL